MVFLDRIFMYCFDQLRKKQTGNKSNKSEIGVMVFQIITTNDDVEGHD